jgi:uncharacterized flavoprotein (TIGR03862 family)
LENNSIPRGRSVAVIGGGPAGLMAAETLAQSGVQVDVYDAMPSVGRKFLLAGKGGMNITHSEANDIFLSRYGARRPQIAPLIEKFDASSLRDWVHGLGIDTFIGTSGRVFPAEMKAAPLLRAWMHRLRVAGVRFHMRHRWIGWDEASGGHGLRFSTPDGEQSVRADATVLALGGGSWPRLGSDGAWAALLENQGIAVAPLRPANCGFNTGWSAHFRTRFAGHPVKTVVASCGNGRNGIQRRQGEFVVTDFGVEGGLIYALSAPLRDEIAASGSAMLYLDLAPGKDLQRVIDEVAHPRGSRSISSHLQSRVGITGVKAGLLRELMPADAFADPVRLGNAIKSLPLRLLAPRPIEEAISSAGGVLFEALDEKLMVCALPGVFCAGEMLDWEAPTGGYLLTACFATGRHAGTGVLQWLETSQPKSENPGLR